MCECLGDWTKLMSINLADSVFKSSLNCAVLRPGWRVAAEGVGGLLGESKITGNPLALFGICCLIPTTHKNTSWE